MNSHDLVKVRPPEGATGCRGLSLVAILVMSTVLAGCSPSPSSISAVHPPRPTTSTTAPTGTTTTPTSTTTVREGCTPGCRFPSNYDAITVLASSATLVATVTTHGRPGPASTGHTVITTNEVLQSNYHGLIYGDPKPDLPRLLVQSGQVVNGQSYLVFTSYDRGGSCLSALYSFNPGTQTATLMQSNDGQSNRILLSGRVIQVPPAMTLADTRVRMYPTGGVVYPTDAVEWYCPGP